MVFDEAPGKLLAENPLSTGLPGTDDLFLRWLTRALCRRPQLVAP